MPVKLSTTIQNIDTKVSNSYNKEIIFKFFEYLKNLDTSENYQNGVIKAIIHYSDFFDEFSTNSNFRNVVSDYLKDIRSLDLLQDSINQKIMQRKNNGKQPLLFIETKVFEFGDHYELWQFIFKNKKILFDIKNWKIYNQLAKATTETVTKSTTIKYNIEGSTG